METKKIKEVKASQEKQPEPVLSMEGKARVLIPSERVFEEGWELLNKLYGVDLRKL
jgi:hypothetical protein